MVIKEILKQKGISYQELANRINERRVSSSRKATSASIAQIVNGDPSLKSLREIAEIIGCKVGDFFADECSNRHTLKSDVPFTLSIPNSNQELKIELKDEQIR